jgi:hypothetical protein
MMMSVKRIHNGLPTRFGISLGGARHDRKAQHYHLERGHVPFDIHS